MSDPRLGRIGALDGIRAIAVIMVMIAHSGADWIVPGGFGVTIFFFLSGYLITTLMRAEIIDTGTIDLKAFYVRRALRILPPLYVTLGLCMLLWTTGVFKDVPTPDVLTVFSQFAFFHNYTELFGNLPSLPSPGVWSLAIEEHYYLVFPFFYLLVLRSRSRSQQVAACLIACAIPLIFRLINVAMLEDYGVNYHWTHTRIDSILFGACLALSNNPAIDTDAWRPNGWHALAALALILLTFALRSPLFRETIRYDLQGAALYILFSYAVWDRGVAGRLLSSRPARRVARYSYVLYLGHLPILFALRGMGVRPMALLLVLAAVGAFLYAAALNIWLERPLSRWRSQLHGAGGIRPFGRVPDALAVRLPHDAASAGPSDRLRPRW